MGDLAVFAKSRFFVWTTLIVIGICTLSEWARGEPAYMAPFLGIRDTAISYALLIFVIASVYVPWIIFALLVRLVVVCLVKIISPFYPPIKILLEFYSC